MVLQNSSGGGGRDVRQLKKKRKESEAPCVTPARLRGDPKVSQREEPSGEHVGRALPLPWKSVTWPFSRGPSGHSSATWFPGALVTQGRLSKPALAWAKLHESTSRGAREPKPYPGAGRRSPGRTPRCGGNSHSRRSSGSRPCMRSAAGPSGCRAPRPPGPCLRETETRLLTFHLEQLPSAGATSKAPTRGRGAQTHPSGQ